MVFELADGWHVRSRPWEAVWSTTRTIRGQCPHDGEAGGLPQAEETVIDVAEHGGADDQCRSDIEGSECDVHLRSLHPAGREADCSSFAPVVGMDHIGNRRVR